MNIIKVWDLPVRLCHWALAACVLANLAFTESGSNLHEFIGYTAGAIVVFRLLWGLIGSRYARFSDFWPAPARLHAHWQLLKQHQPSRHLGHNPFGALMMLALWAVVIGLGISGYLMNTDQFWGDETVEAVHEILANSLMVLVGLHVLAALLMSHIEKTNLVRAMITGKKQQPD